MKFPELVAENLNKKEVQVPNGLKGNEIPLSGRIIAVADTFDAITSNRAYRSAKSFEDAMAIIEDVKGTQLDPEIVEVFKEIINDKTTMEKERNYAC